MAITAILDLQLKADSLATAHKVLHATLTDTRAFPGCLEKTWVDPSAWKNLNPCTSIPPEESFAKMAYRCGFGGTESEVCRRSNGSSSLTIVPREMSSIRLTTQRG